MEALARSVVEEEKFAVAFVIISEGAKLIPKLIISCDCKSLKESLTDPKLSPWRQTLFQGRKVATLVKQIQACCITSYAGTTIPEQLHR